MDAPRDRGTNARARGMSPRQLGTNPTAGTESDIARIHRHRDVAHRVLAAVGLTWCERCQDGHTYHVAGRGWLTCACRPIPALVAAEVAQRFGHLVTDRGRGWVNAPGVYERVAVAAGLQPP